jgi:hypothetical protein
MFNKERRNGATYMHVNTHTLLTLPGPPALHCLTVWHAVTKSSPTPVFVTLCVDLAAIQSRII